MARRALLERRGDDDGLADAGEGFGQGDDPVGADTVVVGDEYEFPSRQIATSLSRLREWESYQKRDRTTSTKKRQVSLPGRILLCSAP